MQAKFNITYPVDATKNVTSQVKRTNQYRKRGEAPQNGKLTGTEQAKPSGYSDPDNCDREIQSRKQWAKPNN